MGTALLPVSAMALATACWGATARRQGLAAALVVSTAVAGVLLTAGGVTPDSFTALNRGLLLAGLALHGSVLWLHRRGPTRNGWLLAGGATVLAVAGMLDYGFLRIDGGGWIASLLMAMTVVGVVLGMAGLLARWRRSRAAPETLADSAPRAHITLGAVLVAGLAPHLDLLMLAVLGGGLAGLWPSHRADRRSWPIAGTLAMLGLLGAWYALDVVAGGGLAGRWLRSLPDAPFSGPFEIAVALPLGLAAWSLMGGWPLQGRPHSRWLPALGGLLLARLVGPALSDGLVHWEPIFYPLVVIGTWRATVSGGAGAVSALAGLGLFSPQSGARWIGVALLVGVALVGDPRIAGPESGWRRGVPWILGLAAGALVPLLAGGLRAETLYTTATVLGLAVGLWTANAAREDETRR
jgi:hypothetical protein